MLTAAHGVNSLQGFTGGDSWRPERWSDWLSLPSSKVLGLISPRRNLQNLCWWPLLCSHSRYIILKIGFYRNWAVFCLKRIIIWPFKNIFLNCVCSCVLACAHECGRLKRVEACQVPCRQGCEPTSMGTGTQTWLLCMSSTRPYAFSHLSSPLNISFSLPKHELNEDNHKYN